ncbi:MAG: hypothetical protein MI864_00040 [Pseudomonadales bacterium]|nr:hypothetical protein [Pseudomonadales bacterium]
MRRQDWFELGRNVSWYLPSNIRNQPTQEQLKEAAWKMGLTVAETREAYSIFVEDSRKAHHQ